MTFNIIIFVTASKDQHAIFKRLKPVHPGHKHPFFA